MSTATTSRGERMLRDALEGYGADAHSLAAWNARKTEAERDGAWRWKASDATATHAAVKDRVEKDARADALQTTLATDLEAVMAAELHAPGGRGGGGGGVGREGDEAAADDETNRCAWRERIGGKPFRCVNELPPPPRGAKQSSGDGDAAATPRTHKRRRCKWHARECMSVDHPTERSRAIEIANAEGLCLVCFDATALQRTPPRVAAAKVPGVCEASLKRDGDGRSRQLTAASVCAWETEHSESAFLWRCANRVVQHPTLRGAFLPFCGFHAPRCIEAFGGGHTNTTEPPCPPIDRRNAFGMCRRHVESRLSALSLAARAQCVFADSAFDVPGVVECRRDRLQPTPTRHPLAPRQPPPPPHERLTTLGTGRDRLVAVKTPATAPSRLERVVRRCARVVAGLLLHARNPASALLKDAVWQLQFWRRAGVVATRIQRIFRGNRARRRVRAIGVEHAAVRRLRACLLVQRLARGHVGRLAFAREAEAVRAAVATLQRVLRGGLARLRCRRLRAALRIQRGFRAFRQRCLAWALREETADMRALQRQADANYDARLRQLATFSRLRARRVLRAHAARWRQRRDEQRRLALERLELRLAAVKLQRAFRRHQYVVRLGRRYAGARSIQRRVRGWLTRHMWRDDPGVRWVVSFVSRVSGVAYGRRVVLAQPSRSYAVPSRRVRMQCAALAVQRVFRGFQGRVAANMRWVAMLHRWEWLQLEGDASTDSMTRGHERYGFLLPSHSYDRDPRRHMRRVQRTVKADRGFAYKYQSVLELLQDRNGTRAWSVASEEKWQCERKDTRQQQPEKATLSQQRHRQREDVEEKAVAMAQAVFPVGSVVLVASTNRRDATRFHKARVTAVHCDPQRQSNASSVDVAYVASFLSVRGVRVYTESRVPLARLRHGGPTCHDEHATSSRLRPVGSLVAAAIAQIKRSIAASPPVETEQERRRVVLETVDALADRLRDDDPATDLLIDHRDFVAFVFTNSQLLRIKWLHVIDRVRFGTRDEAAKCAVAPSVRSLHEAWGFAPPPTDAASMATAGDVVVAPMPERARAIEQRLSLLGFLHEPSATVQDEETRPRTTTPHGQPPEDTVARQREPPPPSPRRPARDDLAVDSTLATTASASSAQDLHRLIYELKTLPRERHREKILEVTTRHARSFVCGFPACGRCFSSHEAARLHQEGVHIHQRRLALTTPLTDQYLHAYWPPTSPWNQEHHRSFAPSVGYFQCARPGCSGRDAQFRTRRELQRHVAHVHSVATTRDAGAAASNTASASPAAAAAASSAAGDEPASSTIWLGTYAACRSNLQEKLEGFPRGAAWHGGDVVQCGVHPLATPDPGRCRDCFLHRRRLELPCRLYRAVAVPGSCSRSTASHQRQHDDDVEKGDDTDGDGDRGGLDGYVIFSVDDPLWCPVVRDRDLIPLDEDEAARRKRLARQHARAKVAPPHADSTLVHVRVETLCRDAHGVGWAIGRVFRPLPMAADDSAYEVALDESHVVAIALLDVRAACVVHRCARTEFVRKHFRRDDPFEIERLRELRPTIRSGKARGRSEASGGRVRVTLARYWRDATARAGGEEEDDDAHGE